MDIQIRRKSLTSFEIRSSLNTDIIFKIFKEKNVYALERDGLHIKNYRNIEDAFTRAFSTIIAFTNLGNIEIL